MTDKEFRIQEALGTLPLFMIVPKYLISGTAVIDKGWPIRLHCRNSELTVVAQAVLDFLVLTENIPAQEIEGVEVINTVTGMRLWCSMLPDLKRYKSVPK